MYGDDVIERAYGAHGTRDDMRVTSMLTCEIIVTVLERSKAFSH